MMAMRDEVGSLEGQEGKKIIFRSLKSVFAPMVGIVIFVERFMDSFLKPFDS
jgi:hypothetical protein